MLARKGDVDVFSFLSEGLNYCTRYNLRSNLSFLIGELLMIMKKIRKEYFVRFPSLEKF